VTAGGFEAAGDQQRARDHHSGGRPGPEYREDQLDGHHDPSLDEPPDRCSFDAAATIPAPVA
jgi:hypothetical protein